ncbi:MAG TPA: hypothetical protein VK154_10735 [Chitinophagales bacterium]|nr:hypothetical protein [Chitinophagales bacterium]
MAINTKIQLVYSAFLLASAIAIWHGMYSAQFLEYDLNYGNLLGAFLLSFAVVVAMIFVAVRWRYIIRMCLWQSALFLLIASPATVVFVVFNYAAIFGAPIKN